MTDSTDDVEGLYDPPDDDEGESWWAVLDGCDCAQSIGRSRDQAMSNYFYENYYSDGWSYLETIGYRCVKVRISEKYEEGDE